MTIWSQSPPLRPSLPSRARARRVRCRGGASPCRPGSSAARRSPGLGSGCDECGRLGLTCASLRTRAPGAHRELEQRRGALLWGRRSPPHAPSRTRGRGLGSHCGSGRGSPALGSDEAGEPLGGLGERTGEGSEGRRRRPRRCCPQLLPPGRRGLPIAAAADIAAAAAAADEDEDDEDEDEAG